MLKSDINGIELYFQWWLKELIDTGYIKSYEREPETLQVLPTYEYGRFKRFKTKEKQIESFNLFREIKYTYDYIIIWNKSAEYIFYEQVWEQEIFQFGQPLFIAHELNMDSGLEIISYVDVKPTLSVMQRGGKVSSAITFPLKQRMLWDAYKIYINKVVPIPMAGTGYSSALFTQSFTPQRYLLTDGGGSLRKLKWKIVSLSEFASKKLTYINNLLKNTI